VARQTPVQSNVFTESGSQVQAVRRGVDAACPV
jgi:hypothetical protein